jgi:two-component system cell cycle sensor histidine kinase/response regulator CckA
MLTSGEMRLERVLIVEDDDTTAAIVLAAIADGATLRDARASFEVRRVSTLDEACEALTRDTFAAVLLDLSLPDSTGLDTLHRVLEQAPHVAVIVLTALDDCDLALRAVRLGAQDYLFKGRVDGLLIVRSLLYAITRTRSESQLRHAQQMQALGRLAGGVAHDFNNLLTIILGNAEAAQMEVAPDTVIGESLGEINYAARCAATLTARLLALGRKQQLQPQVLDVGDVVIGMEDVLRSLVGADITFDIRVAAHGLCVRADPMEIEQLVLNLVLNARNAVSPGGTIAIDVGPLTIGPGRGWRPDPRPGDYIGITVRDDGPGIAADLQERMYEPFISTKGPGSGTGLGLSIVYSTVQHSEGAIRCLSSLGTGTTFTVALPVVTLPSAVPATFPSPIAVDGRGLTILLAEDEHAVRALAKRVLERAGYRVLDASNGDDALALFTGEGDEVDLVISDVVMPGLRGTELARELELRRPGIPILFMSGYADDELVRRGVFPEHVAFLKKPWSHQDLLRSVRQLARRTNRDPSLTA